MFEEDQEPESEETEADQEPEGEEEPEEVHEPAFEEPKEVEEPEFEEAGQEEESLGSQLPTSFSVDATISTSNDDSTATGSNNSNCFFNFGNFGRFGKRQDFGSYLNVDKDRTPSTPSIMLMVMERRHWSGYTLLAPYLLTLVEGL